MKAILLGVAANILLVAGCSKPADVPVRVAALPNLTVQFGQSVKQVKARRPAMQFLPYGGWAETVHDSSIATVLYRFGDRLIGERPDSGGALSALTFVANGPGRTNSLLLTIEKEYGPLDYIGCTPLPERGTREEIAVLRSTIDKQDILVQLLMKEQNGNSTPNGPANVTLQPSGQSYRPLGIDSLSTSCFSAPFFEKLRS